MQYLVIMGVLIVVAVVLIIIIMVALMRGKQEEQGYDEDGEEEEEQGEDGEEIEEAPQKRRRKPAPAQEHTEHNTRDEGPSVIGQNTGNQGGEGREEKRDPGKKLWKLVLENLGNWQKSTFVFYENIGIGRGQSYPQFEKFMTIGGDPRISKLHCAIIQKDMKLYLKDMGSRNGTYLNGKRISQPVLLQREDIISVGETEIEVQSMMREKD